MQRLSHTAEPRQGSGVTAVRKYRISLAAGALGVLGACGGGGDGSGGGGAPNRPPTATAQSITVREDEAATITLTASDPDGQSLTVTQGRIPLLGRVTFTNGAAPTATYTPDRDRNGTDTFAYTVSDGALSSSEAIVTVTVTSINDPPRFERPPPNLSGGEDVVIESAVESFDPEGDPVSLELAVPPTEGQVTITDARAGRYTYTPRLNFIGQDSFGLRLSDGSLTSATATVSVSLTPVNDPPQLTITAPPQPLTPGTNVTLTCSATDVDSTPPTSFQWATEPSSPPFVRISDTQMRFVAPSVPGGTTVGYRCFNLTGIANDQGTASITLSVAGAPDLDGDGVADNDDADDDNDGYADFYESLLAFDPRSATSRPDGVDPVARGVDFTTDHDGDGYRTHHEAIRATDPLNAVSRPSDGDNDGIPDIIDTNGFPENLAPRVVAFAVTTPTIDVTNAEQRVTFTGTFADQTGVRRMRLFMRSLDQTTVDHTIVVDTVDAQRGVVTAGQIQTVPISRFAPPGNWEITGAIDARDSVPNTSTTGFGPSLEFPTRVRIDNRNATIDQTPPNITALSVQGAPVDPSLGGQRIRLQLQASDALSSISDVELSLAPPMAAVTFLWDEPLWMHLDPTAPAGALVATSDVLPVRLAAGNWSIVQLVVRDNAGNAATLGFDELQARGLPTEIPFVNSGFDTQFPSLTSLQILTPTVDATAGNGRARFTVGFSDDRSGVSLIELALYRSESNTLVEMQAGVAPPLAAGSAQVQSAILATDIPKGQYIIDFIALTDAAGHRRQFNGNEIVDLGLPIAVEVR